MLQTQATQESINKEKGIQVRGQLKIFFGYATGVGKTYAMLKAAYDAKSRGVDVVAGYIETHDKADLKELLNGLENLKPLRATYKGISIDEFDLDGAIDRRPQLILVDELAHTNADGCRHLKRYQDIEELLKLGIDVYTTLNVAHIESLNDIVTAITGVRGTDRIPDHIFDDASQVELVDIEPKELLTRRNRYKTNRQKQMERYYTNNASIDNLTALREVALRRMADRVSKLSQRGNNDTNPDYFTEEHILVCISSSPSNPKIIRTAARMAKAFNGQFTALLVETSEFAFMSAENKNRIKEHQKLAMQLGAKLETVYGEDIAYQIAEFARLLRVSKIVMGRSTTKRKFFFLRTTLSQKLTDLAPNLDIHIIPDTISVPYKEITKKLNLEAFSWFDVTKTIIILTVATLIGFLFQVAGFSEANIITVYILGVLVTAVVTTGRIYSMVASILGVLVFNFFFTEPKLTLMAYDSGYPVTFLIMFISAFLTGSLTTKIKKQAKQSAFTAYRTKVLLETNQLLQKAEGQEQIISTTARQLVKLFENTVIFYKAEEDLLSPQVFSASEDDINLESYITDYEKSVAHWVYRNNKHAGKTTSTSPNAKCLYLAVRGPHCVYAVVGLALEDNLDIFNNNLLLSMLSECALALEKEEYSRKREEAAMQAKNEQLRSNLLRSISHDLRTPLTSISGNASVLIGSNGLLDDNKKMQLYSDIYDDSMWLINLVENLLSVTRIEDGALHLHLESELVDEVIVEALSHVSRNKSEHVIKVIESSEFLLANMDAKLIIQVIINIVNNAIKYTPVGSEIVISSSKKEDMVVTQIADNGNGIADTDKKRLFEMFFTANGSISDSRRGMGLGLALCKSIITAHGGTILVTDNKPKGTVFSFSLKASEVSFEAPTQEVICDE